LFEEKHIKDQGLLVYESGRYDCWMGYLGCKVQVQQSDKDSKMDFKNVMTCSTSYVRDRS